MSAINRRVLMRIAVAPAVAVPAAAILPPVSTSPDPIFAAIEAWQRSFEHLEQTIGEMDRLFELRDARAKARALPRMRSREKAIADGYVPWTTDAEHLQNLIGEETHREDDTPEELAAEDANDRANDAEHDALRTMINTVPTTTAGALTLLTLMTDHPHLRSCFADLRSADGPSPWCQLVASLKTFITGSEVRI